MGRGSAVAPCPGSRLVERVHRRVGGACDQQHRQRPQALSSRQVQQLTPSARPVRISRRNSGLWFHWRVPGPNIAGGWLQPFPRVAFGGGQRPQAPYADAPSKSMIAYKVITCWPSRSREENPPLRPGCGGAASSLRFRFRTGSAKWRIALPTLAIVRLK